MQQSSSPANWFMTALSALQWPFVVLAAFALGRYVNKLESRVLLAEKNVKDLIERHMPHIHTALAQVNSGLEVIQALLTGRR